LIDKKWRYKNYKILIHNFGVDSSANLSRHIDKLLITPLLGLSLVGVYQLNLQILLALEMFPISIHSFLLAEEASGKKHKKIIYLIISLTIVLTILAIFISPFFINQFFPKYSEGIFSLQIILLSLIPLSVSAIFNAKLQAFESTKVGYGALVRVGLLLGLIATLGSWFGLIGLSLSVLFSTIAYTIFLSILYYKVKN